MNAVELNEILQSDMKLWDIAEKTTNDKGQLIVKTELPHGIGEFVITFEGVTNGLKRRAAAEQWAANIRGAIDEAVGDEAVTARAEQAAARAGGDAGELSPATGNDRDGSTPIPDSASVQAHEEHADPVGEDIPSRYARLSGEHAALIARQRVIERELKALTAYMEVINAQSEDTEEVVTASLDATT